MKIEHVNHDIYKNSYDNSTEAENKLGQLPNELIFNIFTLLKKSDRYSVALADKKCADVALDVSRNKKFISISNFVKFLITKLPHEVAQQVKSSFDFTDGSKILHSENFPSLIVNRIRCRENLIHILKQLPADILATLRLESQNEKKPKYFTHLFDLVDLYKYIDNFIALPPYTYTPNVNYNPNLDQHLIYFKFCCDKIAICNNADKRLLQECMDQIKKLFQNLILIEYSEDFLFYALREFYVSFINNDKVIDVLFEMIFLLDNAEKKEQFSFVLCRYLILHRENLDKAVSVYINFMQKKETDLFIEDLMTIDTPVEQEISKPDHPSESNLAKMLFETVLTFKHLPKAIEWLELTARDVNKNSNRECELIESISSSLLNLSWSNSLLANNPPNNRIRNHIYVEDIQNIQNIKLRDLFIAKFANCFLYKNEISDTMQLFDMWVDSQTNKMVYEATNSEIKHRKNIFSQTISLIELITDKTVKEKTYDFIIRNLILGMFSGFNVEREEDERILTLDYLMAILFVEEILDVELKKMFSFYIGEAIIKYSVILIDRAEPEYCSSKKHRKNIVDLICEISHLEVRDYFLHIFSRNIMQPDHTTNDLRENAILAMHAVMMISDKEVCKKAYFHLMHLYRNQFDYEKVLCVVFNFFIHLKIDSHFIEKLDFIHAIINDNKTERNNASRVKLKKLQSCWPIAIKVLNKIKNDEERHLAYMHFFDFITRNQLISQKMAELTANLISNELDKGHVSACLWALYTPDFDIQSELVSDRPSLLMTDF